MFTSAQDVVAHARQKGDLPSLQAHANMIHETPPDLR